MRAVAAGNKKSSSSLAGKPSFGLSAGDPQALGLTQADLALLSRLPPQGLLIAISEASRVGDVESLLEAIRYFSGVRDSKSNAIDRAGNPLLTAEHNFQLFNALKKGGLKVRGHDASIADGLLSPLLVCDDALLGSRDVKDYAEALMRLFVLAKVNESEPRYLRKVFGSLLEKSLILTRIATPLLLEAGLGVSGVVSEFMRSGRGSTAEGLHFVHTLLNGSSELSAALAEMLRRDVNSPQGASQFGHFMSRMVKVCGWPRHEGLKAACVDAQASWAVPQPHTIPIDLIDPSSTEAVVVSRGDFFDSYSRLEGPVPAAVTKSLQQSLERGHLDAEEWSELSSITQRIKRHGGLHVWPALIDSPAFGADVPIQELRIGADPATVHEVVSRSVKWLQQEPHGPRWRPEIVIAALAAGFDALAPLKGSGASLKAEIDRAVDLSSRHGERRGVAEIARAVEASLKRSTVETLEPMVTSLG